jgi:hypothetical protein
MYALCLKQRNDVTHVLKLDYGLFEKVCIKNFVNKGMLCVGCIYGMFRIAPSTYAEISGFTNLMVDLNSDRNHNTYMYISVLRRNLVKIITLIIYSPPFHSMVCSANVSSAKVANGKL